MDLAVWVLLDDVGRPGGFTWRRLHESSEGTPPLSAKGGSKVTSGKRGKKGEVAKGSKYEYPCHNSVQQEPSYNTFQHVLIVHEHHGAGLNLQTEANGMRVKRIHPRPGQP